jgi:hypothetical protein
MSDPYEPAPQSPGFADHAAVPATTEGVSPKAAAGSVVGLGVGIAVAVLNEVQESNLLGALPPALQAILLAAIPPLLVFLAAYAASPGKVRA